MVEAQPEVISNKRVLRMTTEVVDIPFVLLSDQLLDLVIVPSLLVLRVCDSVAIAILVIPRTGELTCLHIRVERGNLRHRLAQGVEDFLRDLLRLHATVSCHYMGSMLLLSSLTLCIKTCQVLLTTWSIPQERRKVN